MSKESRKEANGAKQDLEHARDNARSARRRFELIKDSEGARRAGEIEEQADDARKYVERKLDPRRAG